MKLRNDILTVEVDPFGGILKSIQKEGREYLWQADPSSWNYGDHILFPIVGRLHESKYRLNGEEYPLPIHGFCIDRMFSTYHQDETSVTFCLASSTETQKMFPYVFRLLIEYRLEGNVLEKRCRVENLDEKTMYFGIGSHPGFQLPDKKADFSSWKLRFAQPCKPTQVLVNTETLMPNGREQAFALENDSVISLSHELFAEDALHLKNMADEVTLYSEKSKYSVTVQYPDCPYLGLWKIPKEGVDYICIEPWYNMPAQSGEPVDFAQKKDLISLAPGKVCENLMRIIVH